MNLITEVKRVASSFKQYDTNLESDARDRKKDEDANTSRHTAIVERNERNHKTDLENAQNRLNAWMSNIQRANQYVKNALSDIEVKASFSSMDGIAITKDDADTAISSARHVPLKESISSLQKMSRSSRIPVFKNGDNEEMIRALKGLQDKCLLYKQHIEEMIQAVEKQQKMEVEQYNNEYAASIAKEATEYEKIRSDTQSKYDTKNSMLRSKLINEFDTSIKPDEIQQQMDDEIQHIPKSENYQPPKEFPSEVCLGYAGYDVSNDLTDETKKRILISKFNAMLKKGGNRTYMHFPLSYQFDEEKFSSLFQFNNQTRAQTLNMLSYLAYRILLGIPAGKAWLTLIDPIELGKTFSFLSPIADVEERVIDTRIWHDEERIEEQLRKIVDHTSEINQRCLMGKFANILEYNKAAGKNAEPLRFVFIADFPHHFTDKSLEYLESIAVNGPSTGVYVMIAEDEDYVAEYRDVTGIQKRMNIFPLIKNELFSPETVGSQALKFLPLELPSKEEMNEGIAKLTQAIAEGTKVVINPEDVYTSDEMRRMMNYDASNGVVIPLGLSGANKPTELKLGGISDGGRAHTYHAMVGGSIGSGKSTMLHAIIYGILQKYSPNEVQLYLIDMKDGIEFKRYASHINLANFRVIAINAEKDFCRDVLLDLVQEQDRRSVIFKNSSVSRIEAYNAKMRRENRLDSIMPRLVVIIDEVQALFDDESDPVTTECVECLNRLILMGGSAYGIQIILSTQDWDNVKGIGTGIYSNIGVRIALKSTETSAKKILADDNPGVAVIPTYDAGQAIFNEYTGHKDYNFTFRGVMVTAAQTESLIEKLEIMQKDMSIPQSARKRLLSADVSDISSHPFNVFINSNAFDRYSGIDYRFWIGEGLGIINSFHPTLAARKGQNMLLVGPAEKNAKLVTFYSALSIILETIRIEKEITEPPITIFDFGIDNNDGFDSDNQLSYLIQQLPEAFRVYNAGNSLEGLQVIEQELQNREDAMQHFVIMYGLNRARRFLQNSMYDRRTTDVITELLKNGPEKAMNFITWANSPKAFIDNYNDSLPEYDIRLAFNVEDVDLYSKFMIDEKPTNLLENDAVFYTMDALKNVTVKLYSRPTNEWLNDIIRLIRTYIH